MLRQAPSPGQNLQEMQVQPPQDQEKTHQVPGMIERPDYLAYTLSNKILIWSYYLNQKLNFNKLKNLIYLK